MCATFNPTKISPKAANCRCVWATRSILSVPLLREGESIGTIVLRRTEVQPFSDKQTALLQTFADQAVIAIGNVRLFEEVQAKTRDLTEVAATTNRNRRRTQGHQPLGVRSSNGARHARRVGGAPVRGGYGGDYASKR